MRNKLYILLFAATSASSTAIAQEVPTPPLFEALQQKQRRLEQREAELEQERRDLSAAKTDIEKQLKVLKKRLEEQQKLKKEIVEERKKTCGNDPASAQASEEAKAKLKEQKLAAQKKVRELREARIKHLVKVTEKMPPEAAARYLADLEPDLAADLLARMKARKAANALALMNPSKAAALSRLYMASGTDRNTQETAGAARPK